MLAKPVRCGLFFLLLTLTQVATAQIATPPPATSPWITSIAYELSMQGDKRALLIHVVPAKSSSQAQSYPCGNSPIQIDSLILNDDDVLVSGGATPHIATSDLAPIASEEGYYFSLLVGDGQPLPAAWKSVIFSVPAYCKDSPQTKYVSPQIKVSRSLYAEENKVQIKYGIPTWYRLTTGGTVNDTVALTLLSTRPISINAVTIRDAMTNNQVSEPFSASDESTTHDVRFSNFREHLDPSSRYLLDLDASEDGVPFSDKIDMPLPPPLSRYTVDGITNKEALTIHAPVATTTVKVMTNAEGTLYMLFDTLKINESSKFQETTNNGREHDFQIPLANVPDGAYPFKFGGTRNQPAEDLQESPIETLTIDTVVRPSGPVGLSLDETGQLTVAYCLSRKIDTQVAMFKADVKNEFNSVDGVQAGNCGNDQKSFSYTAKVPLSVFSQKLATPTAQAPAATVAPAPAQPTSQSSSAKHQPISLHIHDKNSAADQDILVVNVDAVQVENNPADTLSKAVQQLTSSSDSKTKADASATIQAVLKKSGVSDQASKAVVDKLRGRHKDAGQVVATALLTVLKQAAVTYFGIPASAAK